MIERNHPMLSVGAQCNLLSISRSSFYYSPLDETDIHRFGAPDIMNTDLGSQFTSFVWTDRLKRAGTRISMDG